MNFGPKGLETISSQYWPGRLLEVDYWTSSSGTGVKYWSQVTGLLPVTLLMAYKIPAQNKLFARFKYFEPKAWNRKPLRQLVQFQNFSTLKFYVQKFSFKLRIWKLEMISLSGLITFGLKCKSSWVCWENFVRFVLWKLRKWSYGTCWHFARPESEKHSFPVLFR